LVHFLCKSCDKGSLDQFSGARLQVVFGAIIFVGGISRHDRLPGFHSVALPGLTVSLFPSFLFDLFLLKQVADDLDVSG